MQNTAILPPPANSLSEHVIRTLKLALPVMLSRAGILIMTIVDSIMTGRSGAEQLAYYGIAMSPHIFLTLIGIGLLMGTVILTAQADGAGNPQECGKVWRIALWHALIYGLLLLALSLFGIEILRGLGQSEDLSTGGGAVIIAFGWGLPGMLLFVATTSFLEGVNRPIPSMIIMLLANLLNILFNWILIYGNWGAPILGAEGAALATSIVRWFMFFAIAAYVLMFIDKEYYGINQRIEQAWALGKRLRRIGYPMALAQGLESSSFSAMTIFAGYLGALHVAAFQINMTLIALTFMFALGFSVAASVRVGNAVGRDDQPGIRWAGWTAGGLVLLIMVIGCLIFLNLPEQLARFYTDEPQVIAFASAGLLVGAFVLLPDGFQAVMMGSLRGVADVWPASILALIAFWGIMVPAGYWFGVVQQQGTPGLMLGILIGCIAAAVLLASRFHVVSGRAIARI